MLKDFKEVYFSKIKQILQKRQLPQTIIGLDIGLTSVKFAQIRNDNEGHTLENFGIEPIKELNTQEAIKNLFEKKNIIPQNLNISVSGQGVVIRFTTLPKMPLEDLRSSIKFEADKYTPFPLNDVIIDCYVLKELPEQKKVIVLIGGAKKDLIEQKIALLSEIDIHPEVIYLDSIAIANAFNVLDKVITTKEIESSDKKSSASAIIKIGSKYSSLIIMVDNLPRFTRDIFIGGEDLTKRISTMFNLDFQQAEKLKYEPQDKWSNIIECCESVLVNLVTEMQYSFEYFETEENIPISELYLTGGGAYLKGIDNFFKKSLNTEVKIWNPIVGLNIGPNLIAKELEEQANRLGIAIGLALYSE